jgi:hypothetical protein
MRSVSDRVVEKIKTNFSCSVTLPPPPENLIVSEIMWKNIVEPDRPLMTVWRMCIACWTNKATNTPLEYVIIVSFPLQQWLLERTSTPRCMYVACLVHIPYVLLYFIVSFLKLFWVSRNSSVGIATRYGLDGPAIESRWGRDFPHLSRPALGPTQPPVQWVPGIFWE